MARKSLRRRAYKFSVPVTVYSPTAPGAANATTEISGDSTSVNLKPTTSIVALKAMKKDPLMKGDGDLSNGQLVAIWAGLTAIQTAQLIPLAILEGPTRRELVRQYHTRINQQGQYTNVQSQLGLLYPNSTIAPGARLGSVSPSY